MIVDPSTLPWSGNTPQHGQVWLAAGDVQSTLDRMTAFWIEYKSCGTWLGAAVPVSEAVH